MYTIPIFEVLGENRKVDINFILIKNNEFTKITISLLIDGLIPKLSPVIHPKELLPYSVMICTTTESEDFVCTTHVKFLFFLSSRSLSFWVLLCSPLSVIAEFNQKCSLLWVSDKEDTKLMVTFFAVQGDWVLHAARERAYGGTVKQLTLYFRTHQ